MAMTRRQMERYAAGDGVTSGFTWSQDDEVPDPVFPSDYSITVVSVPSGHHVRHWEDPHTYHVHRRVLNSMSFPVEEGSNNSRFELPELVAESLPVILELLYSGDVTTYINTDNAVALWFLADRLQLPRLQADVDRFLVPDMSRKQRVLYIRAGDDEEAETEAHVGNYVTYFRHGTCLRLGHIVDAATAAMRAAFTTIESDHYFDMWDALGELDYLLALRDQGEAGARIAVFAAQWALGPILTLVSREREDRWYEEQFRPFDVDPEGIIFAWALGVFEDSLVLYYDQASVATLNESKEELGHRGALRAVVDKMERYPEHIDVQCMGIHILWLLINFHQVNRARLNALSPINVIVNVMARLMTSIDYYRGDPDVRGPGLAAVTDACRTLNVLHLAGADFNEDNLLRQVRRARDTFTHIEEVQTLTAAIRRTAEGRGPAPRPLT